MTTKPSDLWYENDGERHRVVVIQYDRSRHPFEVITEEHLYTSTRWDHKGMPLLDSPRTSPRHWDFEWCKRDKENYFHMSGSGGELRCHVSRFVNPLKLRPIWIAQGVPIVTYRNRKGKHIEAPVSEAELVKMGYHRLRHPLLLHASDGTVTRNPFEVGHEDECTYCKICDDWLPSGLNPPCDHIDWCDECGAWVYVKSREYVDDDRSKCECEANPAPTRSEGEGGEVH